MRRMIEKIIQYDIQIEKWEDEENQKQKNATKGNPVFTD